MGRGTPSSSQAGAARTSQRSATCARTAASCGTFTRTTAVAAEPGEPRTAIAMIENINERKLAEIALRENRSGSSACETQRDIASAGVDLDAVMRLIVERSQALTAAEGAIVSLIDGDDLVVGAASGIASHVVGTRRPLAESVARYAFHERDTLLIEDAEGDPRLYSAFARTMRDRSHICVPLFHGDRPVGALNVMTAIGRSPPRRGRPPHARAAGRGARLGGEPRRGVRRQAPAGGDAGALRGHLYERPRRDHDPRHGRADRGRQPRTAGADGLQRAGLRGHGRGRVRAPGGSRAAAVRVRASGARRARPFHRRTPHPLQGRPGRLGQQLGVVHPQLGRPAGARGADGPGHQQAQGGRAGSARAGRAERAPGAPRRAHRPAQPHAVPRPRRARDPRRRPRRRDGGGDAHGPRPLQGGQRHARPPRAATCCCSEVGAPARRASLRDVRHGRPPRRRRVRRPAARRRRPPATCRRGRRAHPRRRSRSRSSSHGPAARDRGADRHRASTPSTATTSTRSLQRADVAMYVGQGASTAGSSSTTREHDQLRPGAADARRRAAPGDRRATSSSLHYQPKVDARTRARSHGVEALVRWHHPERGLRAARRVHPARRADRPDPAADAATCSTRRSRQCRALARRRARALRSPSTCRCATCSTSSFPDARRRAARDAGRLAAGLLELEITEATIMADPVAHAGDPRRG